MRVFSRCGWLVVCLLLSACGEKSPFHAYGGEVCELPGSPQAVDILATGLPSRFSASQNAGRYTITLFLEFAEERGNMRFGSAAVGMRSRTEQCLMEASPYLKGPAGELLSIRLSSPAEAENSPSKRIIRVQTAPGQSGHSTLWRAGWGCAEIVHEVLHLVGLVDEYADSNYTCRAVGPQDSIMSNPQMAYFAAIQARSRPSLLYPAQFRAIAQPGCRSVNQRYYACAVNAYRSQKLGCGNIPPECGAGRTDWVNL